MLNIFFTTVANDLTGKLPEVSNNFGVKSDSFERFYSSKGVSNNDFELRFVDEECIYDELRSLNIHKAVGLDEIAPRFLRDGAKQLRPLITHIVNLSIESSTVPKTYSGIFYYVSSSKVFGHSIHSEVCFECGFESVKTSWWHERATGTLLVSMKKRRLIPIL